MTTLLKPTIQMDGNQSLLNPTHKKVYFYGSQQPSHNGIVMTKRLTHLALQKNWTIVTNLNSGINQIAAIESMQQHHPVIAVNPINIDHTYPMQNDYLKSLTYITHGLVIATNQNNYYRNVDTIYQNNYIEQLVDLIIFIETPITDQVNTLLQSASYRKTKTAFVPTDNQTVNRQFTQFNCRVI